MISKFSCLDISSGDSSGSQYSSILKEGNMTEKLTGFEKQVPSSLDIVGFLLQNNGTSDGVAFGFD